MDLVVISVGGSIIAPDGVNTEFLKSFKNAISAYLEEDESRRLILVCGGGSVARTYQNAYKAVCQKASASQADWLGIRATHINGELVKAVFGDYCRNDLVTDPTASFTFDGRILVAGGWHPGFSSDEDAVLLARRFGSKLVINLSNISQVYSDDPRKNPDAVPFEHISWDAFRKIVGDGWVPGKNTPFDPIASKEAQEAGIKVICSDGRNIANTMSILKGQRFFGTTIG
ncbi:MAG: UMP kinase [Sphaerochaetaceae bacterium]|nr:UMP kinase [Sphaerochaetaceae bacterium]